MNHISPLRTMVMTLLAAIVIHNLSVPQSLALQDSLELHLLDTAIRKAQQDVLQSNFWHRIIPRVSITGSLGAKDIFFVDPSSSQPYMLPRDAYRLTFSLSVSDILDDSRQTQALFELDRQKTLRATTLDRQEKVRQLRAKQRSASEQEVLLAKEELSMIADIVRFRQLLFDQGKLQYDLLLRSKLELINTVKSLNRLSLQQTELMLNNP